MQAICTFQSTHIKITHVSAQILLCKKKTAEYFWFFLCFASIFASFFFFFYFNSNGIASTSTFGDAQNMNAFNVYAINVGKCALFNEYDIRQMCNLLELCLLHIILKLRKITKKQNGTARCDEIEQQRGVYNCQITSFCSVCNAKCCILFDCQVTINMSTIGRPINFLSSM